MWQNPQVIANLIKFTQEILNGKFYFLCSDEIIMVAYFRTKNQEALLNY